MERKYPRQDKIINLLHERHLSRREFAEQIGMTESGLSGRLTGRVKLKPYQAKKNCSGAECACERIVCGGSGMKAWGIEVAAEDAKKIMEAVEEDKKLVTYEQAKMMAFARMMNDMLEHLEIEAKYGFITEKERRKIMEGLKLIAEVYKDQNKDEIRDRINKYGAKRIKEKFGHLVTVKEVDEDELGSGS